MLHPPERRGGSRAAWPGSPVLRLVALTVLVVATSGAFGAYLAVSGGSTPTTDRYGQLPSWLPKAKIPVNRVVNASPTHPWLAIQGDTVSVHLARGRVLVTAVGPAVPEEGQFPVPKTTPCSFTITLTAATSAVPLDPGTFTILDELGRIHSPSVTTTGGGAPPRAVLPGQTVSLTAKAVLPTGNGQLRWTPEGAAPIVSWDFDVEID